MQDIHVVVVPLSALVIALTSQHFVVFGQWKGQFHAY
jgi:hypothetical protein